MKRGRWGVLLACAVACGGRTSQDAAETPAAVSEGEGAVISAEAPAHVGGAASIEIDAPGAPSEPEPAAEGEVPPAAAQRRIAESAIVGAKTVQVVEEGNACRVEAEGSEPLELAPKPPCFFLRKKGADPGRFVYPDRGGVTVLIVAGTEMDAEERADRGLAADRVCGTEAQGVLVRDAQVAVTNAVHRGGAYCREGGVDEKVYWAFAHDE